MFLDVRAGRGPIYMRTEEAMQRLSQGDPVKMAQVRAEAWEDFLDMTIGQAVVWASQNIDPKERPSELTTSEPYVMGSHATCSGAWCRWWMRCCRSNSPTPPASA